MKVEELPEMMAPMHVAKFLNVCRATAYNWCSNGTLPSFKAGNTVRIRREAFLDWLTKQEGDPK